MKRYLTEEEISKAKADKSIRDKMRAALEEKIEVGKMQFGGGMMRLAATEDAIKIFCDGNGDLNPLYRSRDYAKNSVYGGIIAPPYFLSTGMGGKRNAELDFAMTGVNAGTRAEWFKIIRAGDEFTYFDIPTEVVDLTREHTRIHFMICGNRVYKNQRGEVVAVVNGSVIQTVASPPREKQETKELPKLRRFSEEEVEEWYQLIEQEEIRGATPRFWEDINVGDQMPPTHRVSTMTEYVAFSVARGVANSWRLQMAQNRQTWRRLIDPESGLPDFAGLHLTDVSARRMGMPLNSCAGAQMFNWLGHMITNWMGDTGFLKKLDVQYRRPLWRDLLALCKGEVVKKYVNDDEHLVDLHISVEDYDGNPSIPNGSATVVLPSRHMENWRPR
jgi:acyl dehydratase